MNTQQKEVHNGRGQKTHKKDVTIKEKQVQQLLYMED